MAVVFAGVAPLRMDDLNIGDDGQVSLANTRVRVNYLPDWYTDFLGVFQFLSPTQFVGTVTEINEVRNDRLLFSVTNADADAQTLFTLIDGGDILGATAYVLRDTDRIYGRARDDVLLGFAGDDIIQGAGGNDRIDGGVGSDRLYGGAGQDTLLSGDGADLLVGGTEDDRLTGGAGADRLMGDDGADLFTLLTVADSTRAAAGRDRILDFDGAEGDRIDLSAIDANQSLANDTNDAFAIVSRFSRTAGELTITALSGGYLVQGDVTGDGVADFALNVVSAAPLTSVDFLL